MSVEIRELPNCAYSLRRDDDENEWRLCEKGSTAPVTPVVWMPLDVTDAMAILIASAYERTWRSAFDSGRRHGEEAAKSLIREALGLERIFADFNSRVGELEDAAEAAEERRENHETFLHEQEAARRRAGFTA